MKKQRKTKTCGSADLLLRKIYELEDELRRKDAYWNGEVSQLNQEHLARRSRCQELEAENAQWKELALNSMQRDADYVQLSWWGTMKKGLSIIKDGFVKAFSK